MSNLTLRGSWSTGFNAPGAFNEDKHIGVNNGGAILLHNAEDLREERSQTFILGAGVDNLFDQRQKALQDSGEERDPTYLYGPARPRSYYLSARVLW